MTDVAFYHLTRKPLEQALPELLEKVVERDLRALVRAGSAERVATLNNQLWVYDKASFLPHGADGDPVPAEHPIWLTEAQTGNDNAAGLLFLVDGCEADDLADFDRCLDLFDGRDEEAVAGARQRWRTAKAAGHQITYWKQGERGWEKGA